MASKHFNTVVVGLGAMGSATLYQLAKRNVQPLLGMDKGSPPHTDGSTHGDTRITHKAIGKGECYIPFSRRSYEIFGELQQQTRTSLLRITGRLLISSPGTDLFDSTVGLAKKHNIKHEILETKDMKTRFPQFKLDGETAYYEPGAGFLRPENAVRTQLDLAKNFGATVQTGETFKYFKKKGHGIAVTTDKDTYNAERLVLSIGPWISKISGKIGSMFTVYREPYYWFDIANSYNEFKPGKFPVFYWQIKGAAENNIYGFPAIDGRNGGFKISAGCNRVVDPDLVNRRVSPKEIASMYKNWVAPFFPAAQKNCIKEPVVCMYTNAPESNFVIDWLPSSKQQVLVCSPCSGHGFKHSAAIGETIAELISTGQTTLNIDSFKLNR